MCSGVASRNVAIHAPNVYIVVINVITEKTKVHKGSHHQAYGQTIITAAATVTPTEFNRSPSTWRYAA